MASSTTTEAALSGWFAPLASCSGIVVSTLVAAASPDVRPLGLGTNGTRRWFPTRAAPPRPGRV
ncbi:hypothetical protein ACU686_43290 [Yinghuangia aomiensis]